MYLKRSTAIRYFLATIIGIVIFCEWIHYEMQPLFWRKLKCADGDVCTKILFIADPQIQGDLAVPPPLSYLYNWDSDRFLRITFSVALRYFKPDVLVYLGDLMDEGSIATLPQFHGYVKRLSKIFNVDYPVVQVWLPGDNDIGGELEPVKSDKVAEFEKVFNQPSIITFRNVSFYKVDAISNIHSFPMQTEEDNNLKIVVSHYPITFRHGFGNKVMNGIHPNIFFCAHDHDSKYVKQNKDLTHRETPKLVMGDNELVIEFDEDIVYEIYVPTCSYRMGTDQIGYGAAVIDDNQKHITYTVFWSPIRFPYIYFYLGVTIFFFLYFLIFRAARLCLNRLRVYIVEKQPLI